MDAQTYPPAGRLKPLILRDKHLLLFSSGGKHAAPLEEALARSLYRYDGLIDRGHGSPVTKPPGSQLDRDGETGWG